jgi:hypothetical protein
MSSYKSQNFFSSGPHRFKVHGLLLRHQLVETPSVDGAKVVGLGRSARKIDQFGSLFADDLPALQAQLDAIEAAMDGKGWDLVDDHGRTWPRMVMIEFRPSTIRRLGTRFTTFYAIFYVQTQPPVGGVL